MMRYLGRGEGRMEEVVEEGNVERTRRRGRRKKASL